MEERFDAFTRVDTGKGRGRVLVRYSHFKTADRKSRVKNPADVKMAFYLKREEEAGNTMRDPKTTPHPGDRFRCKNGIELEATGAVISVTKTGGETPCLYMNRIIDGRIVSRGMSMIGVFKSSIRTASIVARGSDADPLAHAEHRLHSEF